MRPYIHTPLLVLDPICADLLHAASFCEFICASVLLRPEDTVYLESSSISRSYSLSTSSSA